MITLIFSSLLFALLLYYGIGELSLTGKVLPVGGIKEKVLAARRSGADTVILPTGCKGDFEELPQYVRELCSILCNFHHY